MSEFITISEWAETVNVPLRTAQDWARKGIIKAKKRKIPYEVITTRLIQTYVVDPTTKHPDDQA